MSTQKTALLAALAHPDDESFGKGGTLALYAQRGAMRNGLVGWVFRLLSESDTFMRAYPPVLAGEKITNEL